MGASEATIEDGSKFSDSQCNSADLGNRPWAVVVAEGQDVAALWLEGEQIHILVNLTDIRADVTTRDEEGKSNRGRTRIPGRCGDGFRILPR